MKPFIYLSTFLIIGACANKSHKEKIQDVKDAIVINQSNVSQTYAKTITSEELKTHVYAFSSGKFQGRKTGTRGQKLAANYLREYYTSQNIQSPKTLNNYFQTIPKSYFGEGEGYNDTENVLAYIEGSEKPNELIILSGHYDHEGINEDGLIFYGADDNASGTGALLEMAQAFKKAKKEGHGPKRSILFLHATAEEIGLQGSRYYTENPVFPLENTICNLNIDMIGRIDKHHEEEQNENYIYLIGSDRLSTELHYLSEAVNTSFYNLDLDYKYNDKNDKNRYYYRSDHYNFAKHNIPVIFYFNGEHEDYHQVTDTPDKINYPLLEKRTQLIFSTAWQLANQEEHIEADKAN